MSFSIDIPALEPLLAALDAWPDLIGSELATTSDAALKSLVPDLADYPTARAGGRYVRTGTLGRLWTTATPAFQMTGSAFEATLGNATPYGPFVESSDDQAFMHLDIWQTDRDVLEQHEAEITNYYDAALERVAHTIEGRG